MSRLPFIDWARGFAVFAMVLWHTGDGWLSADQRTGQAWVALRFVGGLAAPSFLFLAGSAAALSVRPGQDAAAAQRAFAGAASRGLEVLLIGYMLRLQTWLVDAGALIQWWLVRAWLPIALGYGLLFVSLRRWGSGQRVWPRALLAVLLCGVGFWQVEPLAPGRLPRLLQVDVLQAIGASLFLLALGQRSVRLLERPALLSLLGAAIAGWTDYLTRAMPGPLPRALAGYVAKFEVPAGTPVPALFPLFPWLAYAFLGAAWATILKRARGQEERVIVGSALLGALLALLTSEAQPFVHGWIAFQGWLIHPIRVGFRIGIVLTILMLGWLWASGRRGRIGLAFGQNSLRIYWAHMLFAYGVLGRALQKKLSFGAWALWLLPLFGAMWCLTRATVSRTKTPAANVRT
ncbi:MAG: heparan-alpha-glucosaminide N-acetyltransferase domain-containing protein [Myxococcales bacterium]